MNIIILTSKDCFRERHYHIYDERFVHIKTILKSENNDVIEIGILNYARGKGKISEITDNYVIIEIVELFETSKSDYNIEIICALPRPQTLKKVLITCATMGIKKLHLIRSEKVEKSYFHSPLLKEENYTKYLIEGLSQGKRTLMPDVSINDRFKVFFNNTFQLNNSDSTLLLAHPSMDKYLNNFHPFKNKNVILAIGPEGGWNDFEIELMITKGFKPFKISESILRVENAVTAALAQIELVSNI